MNSPETRGWYIWWSSKRFRFCLLCGCCCCCWGSTMELSTDKFMMMLCCDDGVYRVTELCRVQVTAWCVEHVCPGRALVTNWALARAREGAGASKSRRGRHSARHRRPRVSVATLGHDFVFWSSGAEQRAAAGLRAAAGRCRTREPRRDPPPGPRCRTQADTRPHSALGPLGCRGHFCILPHLV